MTITLFILIAGLFLLIKGADWLVNGASSLARKYNISELIIGLTIVAFGTSAPELVVNTIAAFENHPDIVFGNIIGSNNLNLLLILGISGIITPLVVQRTTVWKEIPFSLLAAGILFPFTGFLLNPMIAAVAMVCSSLSVVTNSLIMNKYKKKLKKAFTLG